jgi:peptidoglycan/LPS O-acetylase OafA/YrhL
VTLSALIFGPLLTAKPLGEYFSSWQLAQYFLNIFGDIHYVLPGLFESNPNPRIVNNQLWTIPFELQCYLILGGLSATSILRNRWLLLGVASVGQALWVWHVLNLGGAGTFRAPIANGPVLIIAFLCGVIAHIFRDKIYLHRGIFVGCVVVGVLLACLPNGGIYLPFPATYITIYLGLLNPPTNRLLTSGDYSYGLYLYGYPIQQAVASYGPETHTWWIYIGASLPIALSVAFFSWHVVEKRALAARRRMPAIENRLLAVVLGGGVAAQGVWRRFAFRLDGLLRLGMKICALAGIALLIDGKEYQGAIAILVSLAGCIWLYSFGRSVVGTPTNGYVGR